MTSILLIEDHSDIRENTVELLELSGYKLLVATNGLEGISIAQKELPHVILCDIMMPFATGYEVITALKNDSRTSGIPFIFLTASTEQREIQTGMDMGATAYIRKPFEIEELLQAISQCLNTTVS